MNNKYNKSKTYLLPLLSEKVYLDKRFFKYLRNTYIYDNSSIYNSSIYLLHDYRNLNINIKNYEKNIIQNKYFKDIIINKNEVTYVFDFPNDYIAEYIAFIEGKYSYFSNHSKKIILSYYTELYSGNINAITFLIKLKQILYKDEKLKNEIEKDLNVKLDYNAELTDVINHNDETFNIKEILEKQEENSLF